MTTPTVGLSCLTALRARQDRSYRGGSWTNNPQYVCAARRYSIEASSYYFTMGFRLLRRTT